MRDERPGVSTIVAVLMLTVMLVAATGGVAIYLPRFLPSSPPLNASFKISVYQETPDEVVVQIDHRGGESVDPSSLRVMLEGKDAEGGDFHRDTQTDIYSVEGPKRLKAGDTVRFKFSSEGFVQDPVATTVVYLPAKQVFFGSQISVFDYYQFGTLTLMLTDPALDNEMEPWSPRLGANEYPRFQGYNFRSITIHLSIELQGRRVGWYRVLDRQTFDLVQLMRVMDNQNLSLPVDFYGSIRMIVHEVSVVLDNYSSLPVAVKKGMVKLPILLDFTTASNYDMRVDIDGPGSLLVSHDGGFVWKTKAMVANRPHGVETWQDVVTTEYEDEGPDPTSFTFSPTAPVTGELVQFTYQPGDWENVVSWSWDFGDGSTSSDLSPSHSYASVGVYEVKLTRVHENGETSEITRPVGVSHPAPAVVEDDVPAPLPLNESASVNPSTGSAALQVPITVPPGRGVVPSLLLNYQSSSINSWTGVGWSLNLGFVQRSTKHGVPDYSGDEFVLVTSSVYELVDIGGGEYRAKIDSSFMRIRFNGDYWEVWTRDGTRHTFGSTANSRQVNDRGVFKWCLDRVIDLHGNYMTISYVEDQGQIYPSRIEYTGSERTDELPWASVDFVLEDRGDAPPSYTTGARVVTAKRLAAIETRVEGELVRRYVLNYTSSSSTGRSLLTSITEYGRDGITYLPPRRFTYYQTGVNPDGQTLTEDLGSVSPIAGDFNGDARTDIGGVNEDGEWTVGISDGGGFTNSTWLTDFKLADLRALISGDFNGDGRTDIGGYHEDSGEWRVGLSQGETSPSPPSSDYLWNVRFNGDDRFHSNEAWLRPWRYDYDDGVGRWVGGYSYEVPWGSTYTQSSGDWWQTYSDGRLHIDGARDRQWHAWTYVYVNQAKTITLNFGGDCLPRIFLNEAFDSPQQSPATLGLQAGWNRIDLTGYNQNDTYSFDLSTPLATLVDAMNSSRGPSSNWFTSPSNWLTGMEVQEEGDTDWRTFVRVEAPWYVCTDAADYLKIYKNGDWEYWITSGEWPYGLYNSQTGQRLTSGTDFSPMVKYNDFPDPSKTVDIQISVFDASNRYPTNGYRILEHANDYILIYMGDQSGIGRAYYRLEVKYKLRSRSPVISGDFNGDGLTDIAVGPMESLPGEIQTEQTGVLLSDDFNDGNYSGWTVTSGSWAVQSGELSGTGAGGGTDGWIYAGDTSWTDYEFSVKIVFQSGKPPGGNAEMVFRSTGHRQNEYRLEVWQQGSPSYSNRIDLIRYKNGNSTTLVDKTSPVTITNPSTVKVSVFGNTIKVYVNGSLVVDYNDSDPLSNGRIGLGVIWDWHCHFDDVTVTGSTGSSSWTALGGGDHGGQDWIISSSMYMAGVHRNIGTFRIGPGVTVWVKPWDGSDYGSIEIHANTIDIQGTLSADGAGYRGAASEAGTGEGLGAGSGYWGDPGYGWGGGGAGYGGMGGAGNGIPGDGGAGDAYGQAGPVTPPPSADDIEMGSGGGAGTAAQGGFDAVGGNGGGKILLISAGNTSISGTVSANGSNGGYGSGRGEGGGGGGSGGGILLWGDHVGVTGSLQAKGGNGGDSWESGGGGGGAGGRIKIFYQTLGTVNYDVNGGAGGQRSPDRGHAPGSPGQNGTYFTTNGIEPPSPEPTTSPDENWYVALSDGTKFNRAGTWISNFAGASYTFFGGDFNGDGLADLGAFDEDTGNWYVALSNGSSFIDTGQWVSGFGTGKTPIAGDFNGDGLTDAGVVDKDSGEWQIAYSDGTKFNSPETWLTDFSGSPSIGDFNGDGLVDPATFDRSDGKFNIILSTGEPADLLYEFSNGAGGVTSFDYSPFTQLGLPLSLQVVNSMTREDGLGNSYPAYYTYDDATFDFENREFRGFGHVRVTGADGSVSETWFMQDDVYRGCPYRQEVKDNWGNLFARKEFTYGYSEPYPGVKTPYLVQEDSYTYDRENKHTRISYTYDDYGNVTETVYHGDVSAADDDYAEHSEYVYNEEEWLMGLLSHSWTTDASGNKLSESWYYYDGDSLPPLLPMDGNLTKKVRWLDTGPDVETTMNYDVYGNLVSSTNARGYTTAIEYDSEYHIFPIRTVNQLGHETSKTYDIKTGKVLSATDANGYTTRYEYDSLGRLTKIISPLDSSDYPTKSYSYHPSTVPVRTTVNARSVSGSPYTSVTHVFFDGFGRVAQIKTPAEDPTKQVVGGMVAYDGNGREVARWLPYFVDASNEYVQPDPGKPRITREYDAMNRVTEVTTPDGGAVTTTYSGWVTTSIDANGNMTRTTHDAFGRVVKVEEFNGEEVYATTYTYDALDRLVQVVDAAGNTTTFGYDSLGRKISVQDPDVGEWTYEYDEAGNVVNERDADGQSVSLFYDELNRLVRKKYSSGDKVRYEYDNLAVPNSIGRLTLAHGPTRFYYDELGREIKSVREIDGTEYTIEKTLDLAGRVRSVKYPDNELVVYVYNRAGLTEAVVGRHAYIRDVDYDATARKTFVEYGNGVYTDYIYDPDGRLRSIKTNDGVLQDLSYEYDAAGNIVRMEDQARGTVQTFAYDGLNRLVEATGPYGTKTYVYDSIGNLIEKDGVRYTYGQDGRMPHAVTGGTDGFRAVYDPNGRMVLREDNNVTTVYEWDYEGNLTRVIKDGQIVAEFVYDDMNGRVKKITPEENTLYVNRFYEERRGEVRKYIFLVDKRVASVHGGEVNYLHSDHLGSTSFVTDKDGDLKQLVEYDPFGSVVMTSGSGDEMYKYMGREFDDETGLIYFGARYYDPKLGRFISPDPMITQTGDPQAWNRYAFVRNNPIMHFEVQGNFWLVVAIIGAAVGAVSAYASGGNVLAGAAFGFLVGAATGWLASSVGQAIGAASPIAGKISVFRAAMMGGMEFGISGFGVGMAAGFAGGRGSFRDILSAGLRGFASGFAVGAVAGATYKLGWQSIIRPNSIDVRNSAQILNAQVERLAEQGKSLSEIARFIHKGFIEMGLEFIPSEVSIVALTSPPSDPRLLELYNKLSVSGRCYGMVIEGTVYIGQKAFHGGAQRLIGVLYEEFAHVWQYQQGWIGKIQEWAGMFGIPISQPVVGFGGVIHGYRYNMVKIIREMHATYYTHQFVAGAGFSDQLVEWWQRYYQSWESQFWGGLRSAGF